MSHVTPQEQLDKLKVQHRDMAVDLAFEKDDDVAELLRGRLRALEARIEKWRDIIDKGK